MVPEKRQEHVPYLYSLFYLAMQCINNMNRVKKMQVHVEAHFAV